MTQMSYNSGYRKGVSLRVFSTRDVSNHIEKVTTMTHHTPEAPLKRCTKCGQEFPATEFNKNRKAKDGLHPNCKSCRREYREANRDHIYQQKKTWRENNPEKERGRVNKWLEENHDYCLQKWREYYQQNKDAILPKNRARYVVRRIVYLSAQREYREKNKEVIKRRRDGHYLRHPARRIRDVQRAREWRLDHPEQYTSHMKVAKGKRRALESAAEGSFTTADIQELYLDQDGHCAYCGITLHDNYHLDHIDPLSRGGSNWPENLALTCPTCNLSKHNKSLVEWMAIRRW